MECKKKLIPGEDFAPRVAKKSLWHSLRILDFCIQLLSPSERIIDYSEMNFLHNEIVNNECNDYAYYKQTYQETYNALRSLVVKRLYYCAEYAEIFEKDTRLNQIIYYYPYCQILDNLPMTACEHADMKNEYCVRCLKNYAELRKRIFDETPKDIPFFPYWVNKLYVIR